MASWGGMGLSRIVFPFLDHFSPPRNLRPAHAKLPAARVNPAADDRVPVGLEFAGRYT